MTSLIRSRYLDWRSGPRSRAAIVGEFALIAPILALMLFAIIQYAIVFNRQQAMHAAAREGARVGSLPTSSNSEACGRAIDALDGFTFDSAPNCSTTGGCSGAGGSEIEVTVSAPYQVTLLFIGTASYNITGEGTFRCE